MIFLLIVGVNSVVVFAIVTEVTALHEDNDKISLRLVSDPETILESRLTDFNLHSVNFSIHRGRMHYAEFLMHCALCGAPPAFSTKYI